MHSPLLLNRRFIIVMCGLRLASSWLFRRKLSLLLALIISTVAHPSLRADWEDSYSTSGTISVTDDNNTLKATSELTSSSDLPATLELGSGDSLIFHPIEGTISGTGSYTTDLTSPVDGVIVFFNGNQPTTITNSADLTWTTSRLYTEPQGTPYLGNGLIFSLLNLIEGGIIPDDIDVGIDLTHSGKLTLNSTVNFVRRPDLPTLANLSGVLAFSGNQPGPDFAGEAYGTVKVSTESGSSIDVTSNPNDPQKPVVVAGITAATSYSGTGRDIQSLIDITHAGDISVNSDQGVGILATGTVPTSDSGTPAVVGTSAEVKVTLAESGSITTIGKTGIGIMAFNQTFSHIPLDIENSGSQPSFHSGTVSITLEDGTDPLKTGEADSIFSMGVLGVSSGSTGGVNPFGLSESSVWESQSGTKGGKVTINSDRAIETEGEMSVGIVALSAGIAVVQGLEGDAGVAAYLGNSDSSFSGGGGAIEITTTANGSITTKGESATGIYASSMPVGGIVYNDIESSLKIGGSGDSGLVLGDTDSGTAGANGEAVTITSGATITTGDGSEGGKASAGIVAQSIGGGGGSSGGNSAFLIGGSGGSGGSGGEIQITQQSGAAITTKDSKSIGILAHSIGGGGGNGTNSEGLFISIGGKGGGGGAGATVTADIQDNITTHGDYSGGALLQSIGGGGGHGGSATTWGRGLGIGIGGSGGSGGHGGAVAATTSSDTAITTVGEDSTGILLHSIGGGGGHGGSATSYEAGTLLTLSLALGGSGGSGGHGGGVVANNAGTISTGRAMVDEGGNSAGILAQSVGGGGGHGGSASAKSYDLNVIPDVPNFEATLAIGGSGGNGGDGGATLVNNSGSITTHGELSAGVLSQSIGGGGGSGGKADVISRLINIATTSIKINAAIGGSADGAGNGLDAVASNGDESNSSATILTTGKNAAGMIMQSVGGGGGHGGHGDVSSPVRDWSRSEEKEAKTLDVSLSVGGSGGKGGAGGAAGGGNFGSITTRGESSAGVFAQSVGGGGGIGKTASADGGNTLNTDNVTVGGYGGDGGSGGAVGFVNSGSIETSGGDSVGIIAQSIGGGGGDAGKAESTSNLDALDQGLALVHPENAWTADVAVGGAGGSGNGSGAVTVTNASDATIKTSGSRSFGVHAQTISGGGGRGGAASTVTDSAFNQLFTQKGQYTAKLSIAGSGGSSPTPDDLQVGNEGSIETSGYDAHGILAQSVSGGGGTGAVGSTDTYVAIAVGASVDGSAGSDGGGGLVVVNNKQSISTTGTHASGIVAQSIGGGGGIASIGNENTGGKVSDVAAFGIATNIHIGNKHQSSSSAGGNVSVQMNPDSISDPSIAPSISTDGNWAFGIVGQSIGAGGGKASVVSGTTSNGYNTISNIQLGADAGEGAGGDISGEFLSNLNSEVESNIPEAKVSTKGYGAVGVLLQSIGGGGGIATIASQDYQGIDSFLPVVRVGSGSGTIKGGGGSVDFSGHAAVSTEGGFAHGVLMQSIAGGGGLFGAGSADAPSSSENPLVVAMGSLTDPDNDGGDLSFSTAKLSVSTTGDNAFGLVLQSIGGGGGMAMGSHIDAEASLLGDNGKSDRAGGTISIDLTKDTSISTTGKGAHGIVVQSIGGGGGIIQPNATGANDQDLKTNTIFYSSEAKGYGGDVQISTNGSITTTGGAAVGILAQVVGGGGGLYGYKVGSTGGDGSSSTESRNGILSILQNGSINVSGKNATGIFAQNVVANSSNGNDINVTINGSVNISGDGATGVHFSGGSKNNVLTVMEGASLSAETAVSSRTFGSNANDYQPVVVNNGTITGKIDLIDDSASAGAGTFTNNGTYFAGQTVKAIVNNNGSFYVGTQSSSSGMESTVHAVFLQSLTGRLIFDIFGNENHDTLNFIEGVTGQLQGDAIAMFDDGFAPGIGAEFTLFRGIESFTFVEEFLRAFKVEGLSDAYEWTATLGPEDSSINLLISVPEPASFAFLVSLVAGFAAFGRRNTRRRN